MLQWVQPGVVGGADDLGVVAVGGRAQRGCHVVASQTLRVTYGIELPGVKGHAVQRALQDPVAYVERDQDSFRHRHIDREAG